MAPFLCRMKLRRGNLLFVAALVFLVAGVYNYVSFFRRPFSAELCQLGQPGALQHESRPNDWTSLQLNRLETMRSFCFPYGLKKQSLKHIRDDEMLPSGLLFNDKYRIIFCPVSKVASTNWKRTFQVLGGIVNLTDPSDIGYSAAHEGTKPIRLSSLNSTEQLWRLATYRKFLFARHPFERLLSAYIDKMRDDSAYSINTYQKTLGSYILEKYRPGAAEEIIERGNDVTFAEFVQYLTDPTENDSLVDMHWKPMNVKCRPCDIMYDFIGKYETLATDVPIILTNFGIDLTFSFPPREKPKANFTSPTVTLLTSHMQQLTQEQLQNLYKVYQNDFEMFGYDYLDWNSSFLN